MIRLSDTISDGVKACCHAKGMNFKILFFRAHHTDFRSGSDFAIRTFNQKILKSRGGCCNARPLNPKTHRGAINERSRNDSLSLSLLHFAAALVWPIVVNRPFSFSFAFSYFLSWHPFFSLLLFTYHFLAVKQPIH